MLTQAIKTSHTASAEERASILRQIYSQVLERQPYAFERQQMADLEKGFIKGKLGIRHFLKNLAVSQVYLRCFYECSSNIKFIENAFKPSPTCPAPVPVSFADKIQKSTATIPLTVQLVRLKKLGYFDNVAFLPKNTPSPSPQQK